MTAFVQIPQLILPLFHGHPDKRFTFAIRGERDDPEKVATKTGRKRYSAEFRQQALLRAVKDGVPMAAQDLGLEASQLYAWRSKVGQQGQDAEAQRLMQSEQTRLKREVALLEEEVAFLKKAAAYFAQPPK